MLKKNATHAETKHVTFLTAALTAAVTLGVLCGCSGGKSASGYSLSPGTGGETAFSIPQDYAADAAGSRIEIDAIFEAPGAGNTTYIQDSACLDMVFGSDEVTLDDLYAAVDRNRNISDRFKTLLKAYCAQYVTKAPDADRRILRHNLKTIVVKETDGYGLALDSFSTEAAACYTLDENVITVLTQYSFAEGTWEYQILFHELSHAARNATVKTAARTYVLRSGGLSFSEVMCDETLNTVFVSLFDYEEPDLAYQLQSNYVDVLISSMDNYEPSDYINHSQSYFIRKLDEYGGYENCAAGMIRLLQAQYDDFHDDSFRREQSEYYPLYDFVADVFYKDRIGPGTSSAEAEQVYEELIRRVTFDVPEEYELDTDHFHEHFLAYCEGLGILG